MVFQVTFRLASLLLIAGVEGVYLHQNQAPFLIEIWMEEEVGFLGRNGHEVVAMHFVHFVLGAAFIASFHVLLFFSFCDRIFWVVLPWFSSILNNYKFSR